jgi:hypothetical protein
LAEDDNHNGEKTGGNDCLKEGTSAVCVSRSVMLVWWREGRLFRQNGSGGR